VTASGLVAQARALGFDLDLPKAMVFEEVDGFQPGLLDGETAGAEIMLYDRYDAADMMEAFGEITLSIGRIAAFSWGSSFIEGAFAHVVAAALVAGHDGVCFDPQEGEMLPVERIVAIAYSLKSAEGTTAG